MKPTIPSNPTAILKSVQAELESDRGESVRKLMVRAIAEFELLKAGDKVLVAVSGGKDSTLMLLMLREIQKRAPYDFTIQPVLVDQKQPGFDKEAFEGWLEELGFRLDIIEEDTYSIVKEKTKPGKAFCGLCSRLRRGILYSHAKAHGYTKIALGHHREDLNQTLLMNLFFGGKLASMAPKKVSREEGHVIIRPLCFVPEREIIELEKKMKFPVIPCNLCGNQDGLQRVRVQKLLEDVAKSHPHISESILAAQSNIKPSMLMDSRYNSEYCNKMDTL